MMLADHGADVLRVERPDKVQLKGAEVRESLASFDVLSRSRQSAAIDIKTSEGRALLLRLSERADVFIEGFRPGVAERLGIGPEVLCDRNDRLVYGRMTGWGQHGPLAQRAGHDINYIAVAGIQAHIGRSGQPPSPPLNLVGDFGGGGMLLAFGICAALVERSLSGRGQVLDAAMIDGASLLMAPLFGAHGSGFWSDERGTNLLDSGAPFYDCYECSDGGYMAVGAIEEAFFAQLLMGLGLPDDLAAAQHDQSQWPVLHQQIAAAFAQHPRDFWAEKFADLDACAAPVLTMGEAPGHHHHRARGSFVEVDGVTQPAPAPRFSRSDPGVPSAPQMAGANTSEVLQRWGISLGEIAELERVGAVA
jgi:alpha-methylacyl-CoA racemase